MVVAGQAARVAGPRIGNGSGSIGGDHIDIKVDEALAGDCSVDAAHAVRGMAGRAGEAVVNVPGVFAETGVGHDLVWIVALRTKSKRSIYAEVRRGKKIGNELAGSGSLAELVAAFQDVRPS